MLLLYIANFFDINTLVFNKRDLGIFVYILKHFISVITVGSIAYFFAMRIKTSQIISIILSDALFLAVLAVENHELSLPIGLTPAALIIPFLATFLLKMFYPIFSLKLREDTEIYYINRLINYLPVFLITFIVTLLIYVFFYKIAYLFAIFVFSNVHIKIPTIIALMIRDFVVDLFWFAGIHGSHVIYTVTGQGIFTHYMFPNLKYIEFHRLFVNIGGDGLGLPMALAFLFALKDKSYKTITRISFPFTFFNIDSLLIYGIIVFNRYFFIPFVFLPLANILIAYAFLRVVPVDFTSYHLVWTTPPIINAYLKTDGNPLVISLQIFLIFFDTLVYYYFAKKFHLSNSTLSNKQILEKNLEITEELKAKETILAFKAKKELIDAQAKLNEIVNSLNPNSLKIYYQPKINVKTNECDKFESLIRYFHDGKITGPVFLDTLEKAGLAPVIDIWVCKEVKKDMEKWKKEGLNPEISVNLHPDTIKSKDAVKKVISILKDEKIAFEIIERSLLYGKIAEENIKEIRKAGFKISLDDFGVGYSSLETLAKINIEELKIDKSLIDIIDTPKGYNICKYVTKLCHKLDCEVVAEGVETEKQMKKVKEIDVDLIQGFIFSQALPLEKAIKFAKDFNSNDS